ncbi:Neurogenic locus notch protein-like protein, partial [Ophiophagus hannah]
MFFPLIKAVNLAISANAISFCSHPSIHPSTVGGGIDRSHETIDGLHPTLGSPGPLAEPGLQGLPSPPPPTTRSNQASEQEGLGCLWTLKGCTKEYDFLHSELLQKGVCGSGGIQFFYYRFCRCGLVGVARWHWPVLPTTQNVHSRFSRTGQNHLNTTSSSSAGLSQGEKGWAALHIQPGCGPPGLASLRRGGSSVRWSGHDALGPNSSFGKGMKPWAKFAGLKRPSATLSIQGRQESSLPILERGGGGPSYSPKHPKARQGIMEVAFRSCGSFIITGGFQEETGLPLVRNGVGSSAWAGWSFVPGDLVWLTAAGNVSSAASPPLHSLIFSLPLGSPLYDQYCKDHFSDGNCDKGCNSAECEWDGLDCANHVPERLADGTLVIVVLINPDILRNNSLNFLRELSRVLHTNVVFKRDAKGESMIFPYFGNPEELKKHRIKRSADGWPDMSEVVVSVTETLHSTLSRRPKRELDQVEIYGSSRHQVLRDFGLYGPAHLEEQT